MSDLENESVVEQKKSVEEDIQLNDETTIENDENKENVFINPSINKRLIVPIIFVALEVIGLIFSIASVAKVNHKKEEPVEEYYEYNDYQYNAVTLVELNVRSGPSTSYGVRRVLPKGSEVLVIEEDLSQPNYDWYRIGDDEWIADDGSWIEFYGDH